MDDVTEIQQTLFLSRNKVMKIFNFGKCTSPEYKSVNKEIKSINEQISEIKQSAKRGGANSIPSWRLTPLITKTKNRIVNIKATGISKLDAKHQNKVKTSKKYNEMEDGLRSLKKMEAAWSRANNVPASSITKAERSFLKVERSFLGDGNS
ncbi:hypothetical protein [Vibrio cholerae]|uniref:hypothetical protein n=1 Tax=Vibrio cholerae TaxID=666 RepID=UPI00157B6479|nr:hypothetical protein [Vibrio cholerae]